MNRIRNFVIISHIDHGKSTLADRFLELTSTVNKREMKPQYLDMMDLEREKGITIKMQPVRMKYVFNSNSYILNLIDTPGHVDFSYEVSRSLAAVEGAILLVDGTRGIQAQTLSNLELARKQKLTIIPAINKIDLPQVRIEETKIEIAQLLSIPVKDIFLISARRGDGVSNLLNSVIKIVPSPKGNPQKPLRALIFDSKYDPYKGVIAYVRIVDGEVRNGDKIYLLAGKIEGKVKELGFLTPEFSRQEKIMAGEIGYIATGIKESGKVRVGDTIVEYSDLRKTSKGFSISPLSGYLEPKPMMFTGIYPQNTNDYDLLKEALTKLKLNDASLSFEPETREFLGRGFRCGFLGSLHAEIVTERIRREFGLDLIITTPQVVYRAVNKKGEKRFLFSAQDFPKSSGLEEIQEPWARLEIITPSDYMGRVLEILGDISGESIETKYFGSNRVLLSYNVPLREIIVGFYDKLKGSTQGFASMNYEVIGYRKANLVKLEFLIAGKKEEAFSTIVSEDKAYPEARQILKKMKAVLPSQLFSVALQAQANGRIIARENIKAKRRDVIAPLYGGDYSRKKKLLERQKKGKKKLKNRGQIHIPPKVFLEVFKIK